MRRGLVCMIMLLGLLLAAPAAFGAPVLVTGVEFLPNKSVSIPFAAQKNAPASRAPLQKSESLKEKNFHRHASHPILRSTKWDAWAPCAAEKSWLAGSIPASRSRLHCASEAIAL